MATSAPAPTPAFDPLPLRTRGVLEILDITIKLFRRYFWVLAAWSAAVVGGSYGIAVLGVGAGALSARGESFSFETFGITAVFSILIGAAVAFFLWPMILGAATCCIAAAVRGQQVTFKQCWLFTKPRYGSILGLFLGAAIVAWLAMFAYIMICVVMVGVGAMALRSAPSQVGVVLGITAMVTAYVVGFVLGLVTLMWMFMVPMVPCLEGDTRNTGPMRRAWDLLVGNWRRAISLMFLVGVCMMAVNVILQATTGMFSLFSAGANPSGAMPGATAGIGFVVYMVLSTLVSVVTTPFMFLLIAMFYLDLRVRKEALDIEWSAHVTSRTDEAPLYVAPVAPAFDPVVPFQPTADWSAFSSANATAPLPVESTVPDFVAQNQAPPVQPTDNMTLSANAPVMTVPLPPEPVADAAGETAQPGNMTAITSAPEVLHTPAEAAPAPASTRNDVNAATLPPNVALAGEKELEQPPATATATCAQCGAEAPAGQAFCMKCGARLARRSSPSDGPLL
jgi:hypothetical protein